MELTLLIWEVLWSSQTDSELTPLSRVAKTRFSQVAIFGCLEVEAEQRQLALMLIKRNVHLICCNLLNEIFIAVSKIKE